MKETNREKRGGRQRRRRTEKVEWRWLHPSSSRTHPCNLVNVFQDHTLQNPATDIKQPTAIKNQHQLLVPGPGERAKRERKRKREKIDLERDPPWKWLISLFPPPPLLSLSLQSYYHGVDCWISTYVHAIRDREGKRRVSYWDNFF